MELALFLSKQEEEKKQEERKKKEDEERFYKEAGIDPLQFTPPDQEMLSDTGVLDHQIVNTDYALVPDLAHSKHEEVKQGHSKQIDVRGYLNDCESDLDLKQLRQKEKYFDDRESNSVHRQVTAKFGLVDIDHQQQEMIVSTTSMLVHGLKRLDDDFNARNHLQKQSLLYDAGDDNDSLGNNRANSHRSGNNSSVEELVSPNTLAQIRQLEYEQQYQSPNNTPVKDDSIDPSQELPRNERSNEPLQFAQRNGLGFVANSQSGGDASQMSGGSRKINGHQPLNPGQCRGPNGQVYTIVRECDPMIMTQSPFRKRETELQSIIQYHSQLIERKMQMCLPVFENEVQPLE